MGKIKELATAREDAWVRIRKLKYARKQQIVQAVGEALARCVVVKNDGALLIQGMDDGNKALLIKSLREAGVGLEARWTPAPPIVIDETTTWQAFEKQMEATAEQWSLAGHELEGQTK